MSIIDMRLRYRMVEMALDIEHHTKLQLLRKIDEYDEDGYQVAKEHIDSLEILLKSMKVIILFGYLLKLYRLENQLDFITIVLSDTLTKK